MLASLKSWLRPTPPATAARPRLGLQQLEAREVPAALLDLSGNLTVTGTAGDDHMYLTNVGGSLTVMLNGATDPIQRQYQAPGGLILTTSHSSISAAAVRSIRMNGLAGNDNISASAAPVGVTIDGGDDSDFLSGSQFRDVIFTGEGSSNTVYGNGGNDGLYGGGGNDVLYGGLGDDVLFGSSGNDWMYGDAGQDSLFGGIGIDNLNGGDGNDQLHGERDNDTLRGGVGDDTLDGGAGDDTGYGDGGNDTLHGRSGNDFLYGGVGNDIVWGEDGNDLMYGEDGNDRLYGGAGNDNLFGNAGNDGLFGGAGTNTQAGGDGADRFLTWNGGTDTIASRQSIDAIVPFHNTPGDSTYRPGVWTETDILRVDTALDNLQRHTGNTRLLKRADMSDLPGFFATGLAYSDTGTGGWNVGGAIVIVNPAAHGDHGIYSTVYHEIGHNWDEAGENRHVPAFRAQSGWVQSGSSPGVGFVASIDTGDNWWHLGTATFANIYGKFNPFEDYATTFESFFMERNHVGTGGWTDTPIPLKFGNLELLFTDLRS